VRVYADSYNPFPSKAKPLRKRRMERPRKRCREPFWRSHRNAITSKHQRRAIDSHLRLFRSRGVRLTDREKRPASYAGRVLRPASVEVNIQGDGGQQNRGRWARSHRDSSVDDAGLWRPLLERCSCSLARSCSPRQQRV
jgi:hypothetical protein